MDQKALMELLHAHEWRDVEFKEARQAVPKSAYETVSAFANTDGGHLVFGVKEKGRDVELVGVLNVDKVQGDFLTALRQREKISAQLDVREELHEHEGADLLLFYVPEAPRADKPVYLNRDIRQAFLRSGGSDVRCSENERNRFLRDADSERYDSGALDFALDEAIDEESLRWYRAVYERRPDNRPYAELSDIDFLNEMGLLRRQGSRRLPTRAAILLFGANWALGEILPRPIVDCQRYHLPRDEADTDERWFDRLVLEENIVRSWRALVDDWYPRIAEHPFSVDPVTFQRDDTPPDYRAFREAMVNLVLHQDYADHTRKAVIQHYPDQTFFWNPGDAFATNTELLDPGEKEVRNPHLVRAFRRIGVSENAGWGLRVMFRNWRQLGNVPPAIGNDKRRKAFGVTLLKETLLSEEQLTFHRSLGVPLSDEQAGAFAYLCRVRSASIAEMRAVIGGSATATEQVLDALRTQRLVDVPEQGSLYRLAQHIEAMLDDPPAPDGASAGYNQVVQPADIALTDSQRRIMQVCDVPRTATELASLAALPNKDFREQHLKPMVAGGILRIDDAKARNGRNQRYVLTEHGVALKAASLSGSLGEGSAQD